jgi:hypothetical protein
MKTKLLLFFIFCGFLSFGQTIFTNSITGTNPNSSNPYTIGQTVNANVNVSGIGRSSLMIGTDANDRYNASGWNVPSFDSTKYFEFTLTPNSGFQINFENFVYTGQASGTGPTTALFRSSIDNFSTNIGSPTIAGATISIATMQFQNISSAITFRIYGFGASGAGGTFSINDFTFSGTVTPLCTPPANPTGTISGTTPACASTNLNFSGTATAPIVNYWQTTPTGTSTTNNAASVLNVTSSGNYYVRAYNSTTMCWSTNAVGPYVVTINPVQNITTQPTNSSIVAGANTSFSVVASNATSYQWQVDMGSGFNNVTNVASYSNATTATLNITNTPLSFNNYMYRCVLTKATCADLNSNSVTLLVTAPTPTTTISTTALSGFTYIAGNGPSSEQNFSASGTNLTANLVVTAPTDYEISTTSGSGFGATVSLTPTSGTVAATTIYARLKAGLAVNTYTGNCAATSAGATPKAVALSGSVTSSQLSDLVAIVNSEAGTISSLINNNEPLTSTNGIQVWQFKVRDGGATLNDTDNLPTILNAFTIAQASNSVSSWSDAINTIALFDGSTFIANGNVTATQIQFSGLTISVTDNSEKTLSLRLSLKCPLGANAFDNEYFGFSISNLNTTFGNSGSGKVAFPAIQNAGTSNVMQVIGTQLVFQTQPTNTGLNSIMSSVKIKAVDSCGNIDLNFTSLVSLASTGSLTSSPINTNAVNGIATFSNLIHTSLGTGLLLNANSSGYINSASNLFDIIEVATFSQGDFAVISVNSNIATCYPNGPNGAYGNGDDEVSFITFKNIQNGDTFFITDNGFERTTANLWGDTEGVYQLVRTGAIIPAGTVITIRLRNTSPIMEFVSPDQAWSFSKATDFTGNLVLNGGGDQLFFTQGGSWNNPPGTHDATYTGGNLLFGFNTNTTWNSFQNSTQQSGLPLELNCFSLSPGVASDYLEYTGPITPAAKFDWIGRLNNPSNWTDRNSCIGYTRMHVGKTYGVLNGGTFVNGVWTGSKNSNWFDCANWQTLKVADQTTNVSINATYAIRDAIVDASGANANLFSGIAKTNNLSIASKKLILEGSPNNKLEVNGNVTITSSGILDMDDSNNATPDGQLYFSGNWINTASNSSFEEGNGTVHFKGINTQIISNVTPVGTEIFYNVNFDNNFNTSISNNLIAEGVLTVNSSKNIVIGSNGYIRANKSLVQNGTFSILNNGQFIQVDETDSNSGIFTGTNFKVERISTVANFDYVYWSSPVENFDISSIPNNNRYFWNPKTGNANGTVGNWNAASGLMQKASGYIVRSATNGFLTSNFYGKPNNGRFTKAIFRGNYNAPVFPPSPIGLGATIEDDNWNLLGNPYPSAISAQKFLEKNAGTTDPKIDGAIWLWKHGIQPAGIASPYYYNFALNYSTTDYIKFNGTGSTPPGLFDGYIASGQGFMVNMLHAAGTFSSTISGNFITNDFYSDVVTFENNMRSTDASFIPYSNTQFFKTNSNKNSADAVVTDEKHRIWLDIANVSANQIDTMLLGYIANATANRDRLYDCFYTPKSEIGLYSLINSDSFIIQGRALPFDINDQVLLGINIATAGNHKIAIRQVDGLFTSGQPIYLQDLYLNIIHNLSASPFSFTSSIGKFNDRFVLRYTNETLTTNSNTKNNSIIITANNNVISVFSDNQNMDSITIFDLLGRQIAKQININKDLFVFDNIRATKQTLLVKIKLSNGTEKVQKVIL